MTTPVIDLVDISKTYHTRRSGMVEALNTITLQVDSGSFTVLQGPSGCGKTTLLLIIGALLAADRGRIHVAGQDLQALDAEGRARFRAQHIGFVFQQFHLIPYLDVLDNVLAPCLALPLDAARTRALELLDRFGMGGRHGHLPDELSSGERQRVALARALLHRPALVLADEPTGNLDEDSATLVLDHLRHYAADGGAVLMVTHRCGVTADRILHLQAGILQPE